MLDPSTDFAAVIDDTEPLALFRRGSTSSVSILAAAQTAGTTRESATSNGRAEQTDCVWHFVLPDGADPPRLGDVVRQSDGRRWTVLTVASVVFGSRYLCACRDLAIAFRLLDRVAIEVAVWDNDDPPVIIGWNTLAAGVAARIQPFETSVDQTASPPSSTKTLKIHLAEDWPLDHNHRLVGADGTIYSITEYAQSERIDALPVATVTAG